MSLLLVIEGPTGVGKTQITLLLARQLNTVVLNADSRQIYRELPIGTAAPTKEQLEQVKHFFVGTHSIAQNYSAAMFEHDALKLLNNLFLTYDTVILSGGSMMYVDALCNGLDNLPEITSQTRARVNCLLKEQGIEGVQKELQRLDPEYYNEVDLCNPRRVCHAVEICYEADQPYSRLRKGVRKQRSFDILKIALNRPREELYNRINIRVDQMLGNGLLDEADKVLAPYKEVGELPNSLNTVGYKELFKVMTGECELPYAIQMIKQNSRRYAKRQLTWLRGDNDIHWININEYETDKDIVTDIVGMLRSVHQHNN